MTDRELLELAAKAVNGGAWHPLTHEKPWNPLTDDGDALRLAVKLHLQLSCGSHLGRSWAGRDGNFWYAYWDQFDGDEGRAMRWAIVRAAAEIGGDMP